MLRPCSDGSGFRRAPCVCCSASGTASWWGTCSSGSNWPSPSVPAPPAAPAPRPAVLGGDLPSLRRPAPAPRLGAAGDRAPAAPPRLAALLVVALPPADGAPAPAGGGRRLDRADVAG